ncbi:Rpn family recombination-promoting nuclease/putative transposase [Sodalis sp. RH22]|uniref:Rpn family recombination-promoting nuclease/putative transposase n=1 Tax=unclassified Sodalis (in: enterobacteria) TaxID=2636512 RepID=UPI0039B6CEF7
MKTFPTPHDSLFRQFFSDIGVVTDFLHIHLPPALREMCDLGTLAITSGTFIEDDMSTQCCDILYSLRTTAGAGYIYCLIEHQSSADEMMAFRLLRYSVAAMHRHLAQGNNTLPLVIPLLFYHGTRSPYPYSTRWLDGFHDPALAQALYCQPFPLVDVTVIPDDEIKTHRKAALLEYVQKHIRDRDINLRLRDIALLLELAPPGKELVVCLMHYLAQEANSLDPEIFFRNLGRDTPRYKEEMMTIAEHWVLKGRQEGRNEGRSERDKEIARNMLAMGLERATVSQVTGLGDAELDALADAGA